MELGGAREEQSHADPKLYPRRWPSTGSAELVPDIQCITALTFTRGRAAHYMRRIVTLVGVVLIEVLAASEVAPTEIEREEWISNMQSLISFLEIYNWCGALIGGGNRCHVL